LPETTSGSAEDDFILEEHSGESGGDEAASGLELDEFQAKEIRQIFLNTLPEYLEPVSQMLEQVLRAKDEQPEIRRALQTTLSSISAAASRVGIHDVCAAVDEMRDRLLVLDDEALPLPADVQERLRDALRGLEALAGANSKKPDGAHKQTIVAALQRVGGVETAVLERLTAAGLVTVDQLRMADPQEIVAVSGLDRATVNALLKRVLGSSSEAPSPASAPPQVRASAVRVERQSAARVASLPEELAHKLRAQVDIEASVDELRAEILRARLNVASSKERSQAAARRRDRLRSELLQKRELLAKELTRLTEARLALVRLERARAEQQAELDAATRRVVELKKKQARFSAEQSELTVAVSDLVQRVSQSITQLRGTPHVAEGEFDD
jgi:hypothetical protein